MAPGGREVEIVLPDPTLPGADWADGWQAAPSASYETARAAAEAAFANMPVWVTPLMALRGLLVAPFGLKTGLRQRDSSQRIEFFPLITETPERVVVGLDDRHLDFRCVIDLGTHQGRQTVTVATLIRRHNALGRAYLATILPFHRLILRAMMNQL